MSKEKPVKKRVLVVAAHPDDEVLGCGGTIASHILNGDDVHIIILSKGITSRNKINVIKNNNKSITKLEREAKKSNIILGSTSLNMYNLPDNRMDSVDLLDIIKKIEVNVENIQPDIVYTHHSGDINIDHRIVHESVITACRPQPGNSVKLILFFEVASSTEWRTHGSEIFFQPNWFVDISTTLNKKIEALECYISEMREWPHPRSIQAMKYMAKWRGASIGVEAAEAFMLGRKLQSISQ